MTTPQQGDAVATKHRQAALFTDHPLSPVALASGRETTQPYHCYDADALILAGDVDAAGAAEILAVEGLAPVVSAAGPAVSSLWLMRYQDTSLGPYTELVFTLAATKKTTPPRTIVHAADYAALLLDPDVIVFCHRLLLPPDAELAIAYGRELLHLDKAGVKMELNADGEATTLSVHQEGATPLTARIGVPAPLSMQLGGMLRVMRKAGVGRALKALTVASVTVRGPVRLGGGIVRSYLRGRVVLRPFDPASDQFAVAAGVPFTNDIVRLGFVPKLVQRIPHAQFVMYPAQ